MKYGFEFEFFATHKGKLASARQHGLPHDGCPIIVEARGQPHHDIYQAVGSVIAETERILARMRRARLTPIFADWVKITPEVKALLREEARRGVYKKELRWRNLGGDVEPSEKNETHLSAGLHITVTRPVSLMLADPHSEIPDAGRCVEQYQVFDYPHFFRCLEQEFIEDIMASERIPGFYEVKDDGRVEYRSLPATLLRQKRVAARFEKALSSAEARSLF